MWITNGAEASLFLVFANLDPAKGYKGITGFIVEKDFPGFKVGKKEDKIYTIVGAEESDIAGGKISMKSPLGSAVMGKKKGEEFTFSTPSGPVSYKLVGIK